MGEIERLRDETSKWKERLDEKLEEVEVQGSEGREMIDNARAYLEDSRHFEEEGDMVRAFEAVVWGWAWLEIAEE